MKLLETTISLQGNEIFSEETRRSCIATLWKVNGEAGANDEVDDKVDDRRRFHDSDLETYGRYAETDKVSVQCTL